MANPNWLMYYQLAWYIVMNEVIRWLRSMYSVNHMKEESTLIHIMLLVGPVPIFQWGINIMLWCNLSRTIEISTGEWYFGNFERAEILNPLWCIDAVWHHGFTLSPFRSPTITPNKAALSTVSNSGANFIFDGTTDDVWEWVSNFIPHSIMDVITCPWWDQLTPGQ